MSDPLKQIKQKLQDEIIALEHELNVELPKEIAVARAHGDLSENAEYKFAKERQGFVNARIGQLNADERATADLLVAHELALRDFGRLELEGKGDDSLAAIMALPHLQ